jgi:hypothetical protein
MSDRSLERRIVGLPRLVLLGVVLALAAGVASVGPDPAPVSAAIQSVTKTCVPIDATTGNCSLTFTETSPVPVGGTFSISMSGPAQYIGVPQVTLPAQAICTLTVSNATSTTAIMTVTSPATGCPAGIQYALVETVQVTGAGSVIQSVTSSASGTTGQAIATGLPVVGGGLTSAKTCTLSVTPNVYNCTYTITTAGILAANSTLSVTMTGPGTFTQQPTGTASNCAGFPAFTSFTSTSYVITIQGGSCNAGAVFTVNEVVQVTATGTLTQSVVASGGGSSQATANVTFSGGGQIGASKSCSPGQVANTLVCSLAITAPGGFPANTTLTISVSGPVTLGPTITASSVGCGQTPIVGGVVANSYSVVIGVGGCVANTTITLTETITVTGNGTMTQNVSSSAGGSASTQTAVTLGQGLTSAKVCITTATPNVLTCNFAVTAPNGLPVNSTLIVQASGPVSYAGTPGVSQSGCQVNPAVAPISTGSTTYTATIGTGGCTNGATVTFSESVTVTASGTMTQTVTSSAGGSSSQQTSVTFTQQGLSSAKSCAPAGGPNSLLCSFVLTTNAGLAQGTTITVVISGPGNFAGTPSVSTNGCAVTPTVGNVVPGSTSYTATVGSGGCVANATITLTESVAVTATGTITQTATSSAGGSTSAQTPVTFTQSLGSSKSCVAGSSVNTLNCTYSITSPNGFAAGTTLTVNATGPVNFASTPGVSATLCQTTPSVNPISQGATTYTATIGAGGCTANATITFTESVRVTANGTMTQTATSSAGGSTSQETPVTFSQQLLSATKSCVTATAPAWPGATANNLFCNLTLQSVNALPAGATLTVTMAGGVASYTPNAMIANPPQFQVPAPNTNCTTPPTVTLNPPGQASYGVYTLTVGAGGCPANAVITVNEPVTVTATGTMTQNVTSSAGGSASVNTPVTFSPQQLSSSKSCSPTATANLYNCTLTVNSAISLAAATVMTVALTTNPAMGASFNATPTLTFSGCAAAPTVSAVAMGAVNYTVTMTGACNPGAVFTLVEPVLVTGAGNVILTQTTTVPGAQTIANAPVTTTVGNVQIGIVPVSVFAPQAQFGTPGVPNGQPTVTLQLSATVPAPPAGPTNGLGAWTVDVTYNPAIVQPVSCTSQVANASTECNIAPTGLPNTVRATGTAASGIVGQTTFTMALLTFRAVGPLTSTTAITINPRTLTDPTGAGLTVNITNGSVTVEGLVPDANGDGQANSVDALCILRQVAGLPVTAVCPQPLPFGDVNFDGQTSATDALCALRWVSGLPPTTACPIPLGGQPGLGGRSGQPARTPAAPAASPSPTTAPSPSPAPVPTPPPPRATPAPTPPLPPVTADPMPLPVA